jgi:2-methylaconitate cis-trans-isomerase PrpF
MGNNTRIKQSVAAASLSRTVLDRPQDCDGKTITTGHKVRYLCSAGEVIKAEVIDVKGPKIQVRPYQIGHIKFTGYDRWLKNAWRVDIIR